MHIIICLNVNGCKIIIIDLLLWHVWHIVTLHIQMKDNIIFQTVCSQPSMTKLNKLPTFYLGTESCEGAWPWICLPDLSEHFCRLPDEIKFRAECDFIVMQMVQALCLNRFKGCAPCRDTIKRSTVTGADAHRGHLKQYDTESWRCRKTLSTVPLVLSSSLIKTDYAWRATMSLSHCRQKNNPSQLSGFFSL